MVNAATKVMLVGVGDLGLRVCHWLACAPRPPRLRLLGRDRAATDQKLNLVRFSALQLGFMPAMDAVTADLDDVSRTAASIAEYGPDVIVNTATRQSWRRLTELPRDAFDRLDEAQFGPWLAVHLDPVHKLMQAVRAADSRALVVNAAFPDAVHPVLATVGLSPQVGVGNVANVVPALTSIAAQRLGTDAIRVRTRFVAHHFVSHRVPRFGDTGGARTNLTFTVDGRDVTAEVTADDVFAPLTDRYRRTGGVTGQMLTAASALSVVLPLVTGHPAAAHAPGLDGLPGGYPVRIADGTVTLDLPPGLTVDEAIAINRDGQTFDGIDRIDADGTAWFTEHSMDIMRRELGFTARCVPISDAADCATELVERFAAHRLALT